MTKSPGAAPWHPEKLAAGAVRAEVESEEARLLRPLEHHRTRAVAEENDRRAVIPVEDAGEHVSADDKSAIGKTRSEHPVRLDDGVHEAGAAGREVVGACVGGTELVGEDHRRRRKGHVGRHRRDDEEIDVLAGEARLRERGLAPGQRKVGERLRVGSDPALADPGALDDPLVRRVDEPLELGVVEHAVGRVGAEPGDRDGDARVADHCSGAPDEHRQHRLDCCLAADARAALALRDRAAHADELALEVEHVSRLDDALEAAVVDAREERDAAAVLLGREHRDGAALGDRLDREHARHHRSAGKVAGEPPAVGGNGEPPDDLAARLELDDLVDEEKRMPVRDDRLDRLPPERDGQVRHATSRFSSRSRSRFRPRWA